MQCAYYIIYYISCTEHKVIPGRQGREVLSGPFRCVQAGRFVVVGPSW